MLDPAFGRSPHARRRESLSDDTLIHVEFYVRNGIVDRVLAVHTPDSSGHCAGCTWHQAARPVWPCSLAFYAGLARELQDP